MNGNARFAYDLPHGQPLNYILSAQGRVQNIWGMEDTRHVVVIWQGSLAKIIEIQSHLISLIYGLITVDHASA